MICSTRGVVPVIVIAQGAALWALAEPAKLSDEAIKAVSKPQLIVQPHASHQGKPDQQGAQQNPNQLPNQVPNQPPQVQPPPAQHPLIPPSEAIRDQRRNRIEESGAPRRETIPDAVARPDVPRESLGLDQLNADEARKQNTFDPARFGRGAGNDETDALVEQLRGLTGPSNRDRQSDQTRRYGADIVADPGALLGQARGGLAGDEPNGGLGRRTSHERTSDGGSIDTYTRRDGGTTTITSDRSGTEISREHRYRDEHGNDVVEYHSADTHQVTVIGPGGSDGLPTTVSVESRYNSRAGEWITTTEVNGRAFGSTRGPEPGHRSAFRIMDNIRRGGDVDPDSAYGQGSGQVVAPGQKPKDPKMVEAIGGIGPGARPDENAGAGVTPRLNVDVDLVGQPNPTEGAGGASPGYQGYNPDDFVRPPRPNDP